MKTKVLVGNSACSALGREKTTSTPRLSEPVQHNGSSEIRVDGKGRRSGGTAGSAEAQPVL
jgi:hypothetical protein